MSARQFVSLAKWHGRLAAGIQTDPGVLVSLAGPSLLSLVGAFFMVVLPWLLVLCGAWAVLTMPHSHGWLLGVMGATAQRQLAPFRQGTRKRRQFLTTFNYNGTTQQQRPTPFNLPQTGYLSRLTLVAHGALDQSDNQGVLGVDGLAGLYNQIIVTANLGSAAIFQASGAGADMAARWKGANAVAASPFSLSTTSASPLYYALPVDIAMNRKRQFSLGLINLQDPQIQVQLQLVFNPVTSIASHAATTSGTAIAVDVHMEYFEVPNPQQFAQPIRAIARTLEDSFPSATVVGNNIYTVPRLGVMTDLSVIPYANSARITDANMQEMDIRLNKTDYVETRSGRLQDLLDCSDYGVYPGAVPGAAPAFGAASPILPGTYTFAGWNATDVPDNGDFRDSYDTLEATTTEVIVIVAAGTTVVSTDIIRAVRRTLQNLS